MVKGTPRDLSKEHFWRQRLEGQASSGLSIRSWCRRHQIHESAFYRWRKELARRGEAKSKTTASRTVRAAATLVPVRMVEDQLTGSDPAVEIFLSQGRHLRVQGRVDRQWLADVLAVLEAPPC